MFISPPASLGWFHPVTLIATWFWSGLAKKAPGTMGTLAALPFGVAFMTWGGPEFTVVMAFIAFGIGIWAADQYAQSAGDVDPGAVVIDEVAAMWLVMAAVPTTVIGVIAAFLLFRFFDIVKPPPIRKIEHMVQGGLGVMVDDILAALYAVATYILAVEVMRVFV